MNLSAEQTRKRTFSSANRKKTTLGFDLYLVLNPHQCVHHHPVDIAICAAKGGIDAVQLRSKSMELSQQLNLTQEIEQALAPFNVPLFINDHVALAKTAQIDGVHLGQDDISVTEARKTLGKTFFIGLTVRSMEEARRAPLEIIDYLSIGGIYLTQSKSNPDPPIGTQKLRDIVKYIRTQNKTLPLIAISGINESSVGTVMQTGVDGVAVVSAICENKHPKLITERLKNLIKSAKNQRVSH